ncbi:MAG: hypothetical protein LBI19_00745 [Oscillospiraceae bacterium]|nr:hypothetical protein [Oscillospiraceae bacterium]
MDEVLLKINGADVTYTEYNNLKKQYDGLSELRILEGIVLERAVLQFAEGLSLLVSEEEIEQKIRELKELGYTFYDIAIQEYRTEEALKEAYRNRILYTKVKEDIIESFRERVIPNEAVISQRTHDYLDRFHLSGRERDGYRNDVFHTFEEKAALFADNIFSISEDIMIAGGFEYRLLPSERAQFQDSFGDYFYLSDKTDYEAAEIKSAADPDYMIKGFSVVLTEPSGIAVSFSSIIAPGLTTAYRHNDSVLTADESSYIFEYILPELGFYYRAETTDPDIDLEHRLFECVPFQLKGAS